MQKNIYIVFYEYDEKLHGTKDVGVIYTLLKKNHNVKMVCCQANDGDPDCICLSAEEIDAGGWLPEVDNGILFLLHFSKRRGKLMAKARRAGYKIIIKSDSDGFEVQRVWNPFSPDFLRQMKFGSRKFTLVKYWLRLLTLNKWAKKNGLYEAHYIMLETTKAYRRFLKALPDLKNRLFLLPSGVFFYDKNLPMAEIDKPKEKIVIAAGRWDDHLQKYPELLLESISKVAPNYPDWRFVILGPYDESIAKRYERFAAGLKSRIELLGSCDHSQVLHYMKQGKILLNTSRWESFGLVGVEALSQGCSLVCTPTCMAMQTADGLLGSQADSWRSDDVAEALEIEMRMWDMGLRSPSQIKQAAQAFFDWPMIMQRLESLF